MKLFAGTALKVLLAVVLATSAVLATISAGTSPPSEHRAGTMKAAASPFVFGPETPANNSFVGLLNPVVVIAVPYVDMQGGTIVSVDFHLDDLNLTSAGSFNDTVFAVPVGFSLRNGLHSAEFILVDSFGNVGFHNWVFTVDTLPPILVVTSPAYPMVPVSVVPVQGTAFDALAAPVTLTVTVLPSHVSLTTPANTTTGAFSVLAPLSEGANVLFVNATDAAHNPASQIITVISDTIKPPLVIVAPANLSVSPTNVVQVSGYSEFGDYLTVNGFSAVVAPNGTWSVRLALPEGPNVIVVAAADQVGNLNVAVVLVFVDSDAPRITLASPLPSLTNRTSIGVSGYVNDTEVVAVLARCGAILRPLTFNTATGYFHTEFAGLPDATYAVEITVVDAAQRTTTLSSVVVVDTTPPVVRLSQPPDGRETTQPTVRLEGTVNDENATVLVNDQVLRPDAAGHWETTLALSEGSNVIRITAVDAAGNRASPILLHVAFFSPYPDLANRTSANTQDVEALAGFTRLALAGILVVVVGVGLVAYGRMQRKLRENRRLLAAALRMMKKKPGPPGG